MKLIDIPELKAAIASERTSKIRCLHKLLFDFDGDRQNRSRIREFYGFVFQPNDKDLLLSEFGYSCNSAELHEMLSKRKLKDDESLEEYFLKMKQLCNRGNVEDAALMHYVINGIPDSVFRKSILYGCENLSEFKQKLRVYEKMRSDNDKAKPNKPKFGNETKDRIKAPKIENKDKFKDTKLNNIRCFNCGALGHKSSVCENKIKGIKCFNCKKLGDHLAKDCTIKKEHSNVTVDKTTSYENFSKITLFLNRKIYLSNKSIKRN
ncbi:hypothetical protein AVEN_199583-1 [Araneus ventricosus]|uniref:CCHC-type domain-containing protein n=1 Tax=Araneus ventricosus TaxID=182803 RepID=A0A4Y2TGE1_ARAVE|nr:hypothetical protein AVEN_199583-1 [Araneus ventricosus]